MSNCCVAGGCQYMKDYRGLTLRCSGVPPTPPPTPTHSIFPPGQRLLAVQKGGFQRTNSSAAVGRIKKKEVLALGPFFPQY